MSYLMNVWVTRKCNMDCVYCSEDQNDFGLKQGGSLTVDTATRILNFIYNSIDDNDFPLLLNFHGGEPLLNTAIIEFMLDSLDKNNVDYVSSVTTNGTMLKKKDVQKVLDRIDCVSISLDGNKSSHLKNRKFKNQVDSYEDILERCIQLDKTHRNNIRIRMTIDTNTVENLYNNVLFFTNLSFKEIVASPNFYSSEWTLEKTTCLLDEIDKIRNHYEKLDNDYKMNLLQRKYLRKSVCTSGLNYLNIDVDGIFYSCTALVGNRDYIIGDVIHGIDKTKVETIKKINSCEILQCRDCVLYEYCTSIRCKLVNKAITGDYNTPIQLNCELQKKMCDI